MHYFPKNHSNLSEQKLMTAFLESKHSVYHNLYVYWTTFWDSFLIQPGLASFCPKFENVVKYFPKTHWIQNTYFWKHSQNNNSSHAGIFSESPQIYHTKLTVNLKDYIIKNNTRFILFLFEFQKDNIFLLNFKMPPIQIPKCFCLQLIIFIF